MEQRVGVGEHGGFFAGYSLFVKTSSRGPTARRDAQLWQTKLGHHHTPRVGGARTHATDGADPQRASPRVDVTHAHRLPDPRAATLSGYMRCCAAAPLLRATANGPADFERRGE